MQKSNFKRDEIPKSQNPLSVQEVKSKISISNGKIPKLPILFPQNLKTSNLPSRGLLF